MWYFTWMIALIIFLCVSSGTLCCPRFCHVVRYTSCLYCACTFSVKACISRAAGEVSTKFIMGP